MPEKDEKILKKIRKSRNRGNCRGVRGIATNSGRRAYHKNDECYTPVDAIYEELSYWAKLGKFAGKNIICPCDWDITGALTSIQINYNDSGVSVRGNCVSVISGETDAPVTVNLAENQIDDFFKDKLTCNFLRVLTQHAREWGIKSITGSRYDPDTDSGVKFQDVDYSKYDICITNPPFSIYSQFIKTIVGKIDFIALAPLLNRCNNTEGNALWQRKAYLGLGIHRQIKFNNLAKEGVLIVNCDWITSYPEAQDERNKQNANYKTGISYEIYKDEFFEMPNLIMKDGTRVIKVGGRVWPDDYDGWMFGPLSTLDVLDLSAFEWYILNSATAAGENRPWISGTKLPLLKLPDGRNGFSGVVFRRKKKEN